MTDLLQKASGWLAERRNKHLSRDGAYQRAASTAVISAAIGRTQFEVDDGHGVLERIESRDFPILTEDLILGGQVTLPQRGDRIRETVANQTFVYEEMAPGREPAWRYSDPYRKTLRIHTKQIDVETT